MKCSNCGNEFEGAFCNMCGAPANQPSSVPPVNYPNYYPKKKKSIFKRWWFWVLVVIVIAIIVSSKGNKKTSTTTVGDEGNKALATESTASNDSTSVPDTNGESSTTQTESVPIEYTNALKKAQLYSDTMYMSKQGIYDQLTSEYGEGFEADAAQYAVDNLQADYGFNALQKAKTYQETMNMSKNAIYKQLISEYGEKFTAAEAQYAVDNLNE